MTKELTANFVDEVRADLSRHDPVQRRLALAASELDCSRDYFFAAMGLAPPMREVLASIMAQGPDEDDTGAPVGHRAQAAYWFLSGSNAGYWTASPQETETARILIVIGGLAMPEKTKADLAREAGLPTKDTVFVRPAKIRKAKSAVVRDHDAIGLLVTVTHAGAIMEASLKDPNATTETKLEAIARYFRIVGRIAPDELDASVAKAWKTCTPATSTKEYLQ
jgi:hypothetical protein